MIESERAMTHCTFIDYFLYIILYIVYIVTGSGKWDNFVNTIISQYFSHLMNSIIWRWAGQKTRLKKMVDY